MWPSDDLPADRSNLPKFTSSLGFELPKTSRSETLKFFGFSFLMFVLIDEKFKRSCYTLDWSKADVEDIVCVTMLCASYV